MNSTRNTKNSKIKPNRCDDRVSIDPALPANAGDSTSSAYGFAVAGLSSLLDDVTSQRYGQSTKTLSSNPKRRSSPLQSATPQPSKSAGESNADVAGSEQSESLDLEAFYSARAMFRRNEASPPAIDGFKIIQQLGADGQGEVYLAEEKRLKRLVALKIPRSDRQVSIDTFLDEARALAQVRHPNIVAIHTFGVTEHRAFFTMELIDGFDLAKFLKRLSDRNTDRINRDDLLELLRLDEDRLADDVRRALAAPHPYDRLVALWMAHAAEGLAAAQAADVLHRDIKPANLIVAVDGRLVVADFGLARPLHAEPHPHAVGVTGTYPYICPERATGDWARIDHRSDIWALGATMYELLTSRRAYVGKGKEVLINIATTTPIRPRQVRKTIPSKLESICLKAMNRDPCGRYQSWQDMARHLRKWLDAQGKSTRLRRGWAPIAAGFIVLFACGGYWFNSTRPTHVLNSSVTIPALSARNDSPETKRIPSATVLASRSQPAEVHMTRMQDIEGLRHPTDSMETNRNSNDDQSIGGKDYSASTTPGNSVIDEDILPLAHGQKPVVEREYPAVGSIEAAVESTTNQPEQPPRPVIFLAFNRDLNVHDEMPPEAGGRAQSTFLGKLRKLAGTDAVVSETAMPARWDIDSAVEAGRRANATHVLFARLESRVLRMVENFEHIDDTVYVWELTLDSRLVRLTDEWTTQFACDPLTVNAPANRRVGVDVCHRISEDGRESSFSYDAERVENAGEFGGAQREIDRLAYDLARQIRDAVFSD